MRVMGARFFRPSPDEEGKNEEEQEGGEGARLASRMASANSRRARLRAAMIRSLTSGRDSTYTQIQRIRRLIRMTSGESNSDDSDPDAFDSDGSHSSADDRRYFTAENIRRVSENDFGADEHTLKSFTMSDSLELPDKLVDK